MKQRDRNLVVRLTDEELTMARKLSEARDEPMTVVVRRLLTAAFVEQFKVTPITK